MSTNQPAVDIGHRLANMLFPKYYKYGSNYIFRSIAWSSSRASAQEANVVQQSIVAAAGRANGNGLYQLFPASQFSSLTDKRLELSALIDWKAEKPSLAKLQDLKLPPAAGTAFGPLVLQDVMLENTNLQSMSMVLEPNVRGAQILHERFSDPDSSNPLDFFVVFSSVVAALAQQRLSNGLTCSTVDIGAVYGVGFVTRAELEEDFNAIRFMFDSVEEY
ncbi:beta-ketoacyl synthase domain-containing protein [Colletotrichum sp. SAR11_240]|nr:beta-ketoacyl synthase domain-containing protein [Colletotrichum sp. SAR11_240]